MIQQILNLLKVLLALGVVAGLIFIGFTVVMALVGVGLVIAVIMWMRARLGLSDADRAPAVRMRQARPMADKEPCTIDVLTHDSASGVTIIEGEAEDITTTNMSARSAAQ
ncbi:MAG: hypothetical protein EAZ74_01595 [Alphaproteobacteria bacterium]|nr:MAG: hypothetical protein EAY76_06705 [Alphaproteobacteria bacterium]TAF15488.1 MAG: hypothetical protein EAZ74_01595 [Alphaproteobacteria bacterium]